MTPGIVAESDLSGTLKSEYVFFDGERVARRDNPTGASPSVAYYFSDHLKTASVITDALGNITAESDYYPWGGELQFIANDSNHYKFTGKERDETGLDYFGARYYSNGLARFITPDWAVKAAAVPYAEFADPQTLNLYTYVRNLPTTKVDADGHCPQCVVWAIVEVYEAITVGEVAAAAGTGAALGTAAGLATKYPSLSQPVMEPGAYSLGRYLSGDKESTPIPGQLQSKTKDSEPSKPGTLGKPDHQQTADEEAAKLGGTAK